MTASRGKLPKEGAPRIRLGASLRHAREAARMSLGEVADRSGVTKSFLSRVERDLISPSIVNLIGICDALGLPPAELFQTPKTTLVRRADRPELDDLPKAAGVVDTLITPAGESHVTVIESAVPAGGSGGGVLYTMPTEAEVCFVLHGQVIVRVEDEEFVLNEGDAVTFGAAVPHLWHTNGEAARVLWILAPGLPDPQKGLHR